MRLGILTSVEARHRYFVNRLCGEFDVVAVGYETIGYVPAAVSTADLTPEEVRVFGDHFSERARQEQVFFGARSGFIRPSGSCAVRHMRPGDLNREKTVGFLESAGIDTVAVFGTNLIKPPLLDRWPGRMVNLHLGLAPYYRGTATNFYPLLNEEPEYIGATIHLLDAGIDSGPILGHVRPTIVADDMPHTIGCKAILAGIDKMIGVLHDMNRACLTSIPQWGVPNPRVYHRKDYDPRHVVELYRKLDTGLIPKYLERAADVAPRVRLVE